MKKIKIIIPLLSVIFLSGLISYTFYGNTHVMGGLKIKFDKQQVKEKAVGLADELDAPIKDLNLYVSLKSNKSLIRQVQQEYGFKKGNALLRNLLPGFYWQIDWSKRYNSNITFGGGSKRRSENDSMKVTMEFDNSGNLLKYERMINDSTRLPSLSSKEARSTISKFISKLGEIKKLFIPADSTVRPGAPEHSFISHAKESFDFKIEKRIELPHRIDYKYVWTGKSSYVNDNIKMEATVSGNRISYYKVSYEVPEKYSSDNTGIYQSSVDILFYIIIIILIAVIAYRKIKAYEIGFRTAWISAAVVIIGSGLYIYTDIGNLMGWEILFPLILGPLFIGAGMFITWAVGETVSRETWKEKNISIDLLTKGYISHSKVGHSVMTGITIALGLTSIWIIMLYIFQNFTGIWSVSYDTLLLSHLNSSSPALNILDKYVYTSLFMFAVFFNLILSGLKRRFKSVTFLILVSGAIWGLVISNDIHPLYIGIILEVIIGILFAWSYIKYDGLTTLVALVTYYVINKGLSLFTLNNAAYVQSGYFLLIIFILLIIYSLYSVFTQDRQVDFNAITPAFALNITERQRLQRELEIARDVQMSFLPEKNPLINYVDIASICVPALEVGGDYYDFIQFDGNKLGVIIGDVSGKGTQAAFYMTLTKGFLKALAKSFRSPANFLRDMNTLFFENVERGTFISMVCGLFDLENRKFILARAGHNPVIVRKSSQDNAGILNPTGLAIGLEKGSVFNKNLREIEVEIAKGDIFVFYTDGFTEARNKLKEEFGEERLVAIVKDNSYQTSEEILDKIIKEVKTFMGKTPQHDDMTMVIAKIDF